MKIEVKRPVQPERKLVGLIDERNGTLFLRFSDSKVPGQRTAVLNGNYNRNKEVVRLNGTGSLEDITGGSRKPIYEGDEVVLKF